MATLLCGGSLAGVARGAVDRVTQRFKPAQPTATVRKLNTVHARRGHLYTGYGGGNTGPISEPLSWSSSKRSSR